MTPTIETVKHALNHPIVRLTAVALLQAGAEHLSRNAGSASGCACPARTASAH